MLLSIHMDGVWWVPMIIKNHGNIYLYLHRYIISFILHKSILLYFLHRGNKFYDRYIETDVRTKYIDDDGSGVRPKQKNRKNQFS